MSEFEERVSVPPAGTFNAGVTAPPARYMRELFGEPVRGARYPADGSCGVVDHPALSHLLVTEGVGPFRVTGLRPAVASLRDVFARVRTEVPALYSQLGTAGMQCARFVKVRRPDGTVRVGPGVSKHSWGTAIDLKIGRKLDVQGDNQVYRGLLILSSYFNAAQWYWGVGFPVEDAMHFEASRGLLGRWRREGVI